MDVPLNVDVRCAGRICGTSVALVLNPVSDQVAHLVVKERHAPHKERLLPLDLISETTPEYIALGCTADELAEMEPFVETEYVQVTVPHYVNTGVTYSLPYVVREPETETVPTHHEHLPPHELAVRRGARIEATDGQVGRVDEFLMDPANGHVTHLVMREGHLWAQKDVAIPISQIEHLGESEVFLKLSKREVGELPEIRLRRRDL
jgi:uncharacterized protein YrrD